MKVLPAAAQNLWNSSFFALLLFKNGRPLFIHTAGQLKIFHISAEKKTHERKVTQSDRMSASIRAAPAIGQFLCVRISLMCLVCVRYAALTRHLGGGGLHKGQDSPRQVGETNDVCISPIFTCHVRTGSIHHSATMTLQIGYVKLSWCIMAPCRGSQIGFVASYEQWPDIHQRPAFFFFSYSSPDGLGRSEASTLTTEQPQDGKCI